MTKKKMKNIIPLPFDGTPCKNSKRKWILLRMFGVGWREKRDYE